MTYLSKAEYFVEVRKGNISGSTAGAAVGHSDAVGTNDRIMYHGHNDADPMSDIKTLLDGAGDTVWVASTSANDTNSAGTGARTVLITGLDASGAAQTESVNLSGQTAVETTNTWTFITTVQVTAVGSTGWNEGTIWCGDGTFTSGVPTVYYDKININHNLSRKTAYVVPTSKAAMLRRSFVQMGDTTKDLTVRYRLYRNGIDYILNDFVTSSQDISIVLEGAPALQAGDLVWVEVSVDTGTAVGTVTLVYEEYNA